MSQIGRRLTFVGLVLVVSLCAYGASPAVAAPTTGDPVQVASAGAYDTMRCNSGVYGSATNAVRRIAFCFFSPTAVSGEATGTGVSSNGRITDFRTHAGGTMVVSSTNDAFAHAPWVANGDDVNQSGNADKGTWYIGPMTFTVGAPVSATVTLPVGAAYFVSAETPYDWSSGGLANYRLPWQYTRTCTDLTQKAEMFVNGGYMCTGNWLGYRTFGDAWAVAFDGINYYPGGAPLPVAPCLGVSVDGPDVSDRFYSGDELEFTYTEQVGYAVDRIDYGFFDESGYPHEAVPTGHIGSVTTDTLLWPARFAGKTLADVSMRIRCASIEDGNTVYTYTVYGGDFTSDDPPLAACQSATVRWPADKTYRSGDDVTWFLNVNGAAEDTVTVEYALFDPDNAVPPFSTLTWLIPDFDRIGGGTVDAENLAAGEQGNFTIELAYDGSLGTQIALRCTDSTGVVYNGQWSEAYGGGVNGDGVDPEGRRNCFDDVSIGLAPSSWVRALFKVGECTIEVLFVPDQEVFNQFLNEGETLLSERAPLSYIAEVGPILYGSMAGLPSSVEEHQNDCFPGIGGLDEYGFDGFDSICPNDSEALGSLTEWREVISVAFWAAALWALWNRTKDLIQR